MTDNIKDLILLTIDDLVLNFLYYDRKEDEFLPKNSIHKAIDDGNITREEIVSRFSDSLSDST